VTSSSTRVLVPLLCAFAAAPSCDGGDRTTVAESAVDRVERPEAASRQRGGEERSQGTPQYLAPVMLRIGAADLRAEVAHTPAERHKGLMFREDLRDDEGMLFLFPDEKLQTFWMKNTPLPLSIAFIAGDGTIIAIRSLEPFDESHVESKDPTAIALEVRRGFFERHGIGVGDQVQGLEAVFTERAFTPR